MLCNNIKTTCRRGLYFLSQVNILIPIFVTLGAGYLVIAPLTVYPLKGEFILTLAVAGSAVVFYVPLVRWSWNKKITGKDL